MSKSKPRQRLFICDDDPGIVDVVTLIFETYLDVVGLSQPSSTEAVLDSITKHRPHVALLDLWMPPVSGVDVINQMRSRPQLRHIPVVVLSASKDLAQISTELVVADTLPKPFDIDTLERVVGKLLNLSV